MKNHIITGTRFIQEREKELLIRSLDEFESQFKWQEELKVYRQQLQKLQEKINKTTNENI